MVVKTVLGSHFGVGEFTTHFSTYVSGDWDVHWGYGLLNHGHVASDTGFASHHLMTKVVPVI